MTTRRFLAKSQLVAMLVTALAVASLFSGSASAQDGEGYASNEEGELTFVASSLEPGGAIMVSGDGFAPDDVVEFLMNSIDGTITLVSVDVTADNEGVASHDFDLPAQLVAGDYRAMLTGATTDGATRRLDIVVTLEGSGETAPPATTTSETSAPTNSTPDSTNPDASETTAAGDTDRTTSTANSSETPPSTAVTDSFSGTAQPTVPGEDGTASTVREADAGGATESAAGGSNGGGGDGSSNTGIIVVVLALIAALAAGAITLARRSANA